MAIKLGTTTRNARLDAIETVVGTSPRLQIRTGAPPATPATADSGTLIATIVCPSDWAAAASGGAKALSGSWTVAASSAGVAGHFRLKDSAVTVTHIQGTITETGSGGDMTLDNDDIAAGQVVTINTFTLTDGNA